MQILKQNIFEGGHHTLVYIPSLYGTFCHLFSHPLPPRRVTYFLNGPLKDFGIDHVRPLRVVDRSRVHKVKSQVLYKVSVIL